MVGVINMEYVWEFLNEGFIGWSWRLIRLQLVGGGQGVGLGGGGRKGREESLLLDSGHSVGLFKGPRMKAGREAKQNRGGARETKMGTCSWS